MNLSEPFIRRPVMTTILMMAILVFGIMAYQRLPVSDLPNVDYPTITVSANLPGGSPQTMSNTVATPLEQAFMTMAGVQTITSSSVSGSTSIVIQFNLNKDINVAAQDVQAAINKTLPLLPVLPQNPSYQKVNPSQSPIIYLTLTSDSIDFASLYDYGNVHVSQRLSTIQGVAQVQTYGSPYAVRVQLDPNLMANRKVDINAVSQAVINGNPHLAIGSLYGPNKVQSLYVNGQITTADGYNPLIVAYRNGTPIRISNIGNAIDSLSNPSFYMHYISKDVEKPTLVIAISRQPGANTVAVAEALRKFLPDLQKELPASMNLDILFDKSIGINESVSDVKFSLLVAFILVVVVIYLSLGKFVDTMIPSVSLPMTMIGTFGLMYMLGFSLDNLSLLALTLAVGFIVDDAIVVLENIVRHTEIGEVPYQAALIGSRQISVTILTMTMALGAVFIPLLFMPGLLGRLFNEFAMTIVITILFSGFISLTLTPMLCSRFVPPRPPPGVERTKNRSEKFNDSLLGIYQRTLRHTLQFRKTMVGIAIVCLLATIAIFKYIPTDFLPSDDVGFISGFSEGGESMSSDRMKIHQAQVNQIFREDPAINDFVSLAAYPGPNEGVYFIRLVPANQRPSMSKVIDELNKKLADVVGINTYLTVIPLIDLSIGGGGGSKGDYEYTLQSLDPALLFKYAQIMNDKMRDLPHFSSVNSSLQLNNPQLAIDIFRDQASTYGITANDIESTLQLAYSGGRVTTIDTPSAQYDVIVELLPEYQQKPSDLNFIYIQSPLTQELIPMSSLAKWTEGIGPASIDHINQFPSITISFSLKSDVPLGDAINSLNALAREVLPPQVMGKVQGTAEAFEKTILDMVFLTLVSVVVIYMVLGILYESFILPFTILSALPLACFGALFTLIIFDQSLSLYALVGIILLIGIVQKNGIMMVDHANHVLQTPGKTSEDAIFEACSVRFRPIIMTTVAAIVGALPIAFGIGAGAEARRPLGLVIVGGLVFSQLLTLFITPVVFLYFETFREYLQDKFHISHVPHHK